MSESTTAEALKGLEPKPAWDHFHDFTQIPRKSMEEEAALTHTKEWAESKGFEWKEDEAHNLCIKVPGSPGFEDKPTVCLQGHIDMICEKTSDSNIDPTTDPLELTRDGDKVSAVGTSLGADNIIAIACAMAVAEDPNSVHPPMEILLTVGEEIGFVGALKLDYEALDMQSTSLMNLDNEDVGETCVQSAGLVMSEAQLVGEQEKQKTPGNYLKLTVKDLPGGHSAVDIVGNPPNAIKVMVNLVRDLDMPARLVSINGGTAVNSIPTACEAIVFVEGEVENIDVVAGLNVGEMNFSVETIKDDDLCDLMTAETHERVIDALDNAPNGVAKMHPEFKGIAYTSSNIGVVNTTPEGNVKVGFSVRSPEESEMRLVRNEIARTLEENGFDKVQDGFTLACWDADRSTDLIGAVNEAYKFTTGKAAVFGGTHGGLETGTVRQGLEDHSGQPIPAVSFGPTIKKPHSPDEHVFAGSVKVFAKQLEKALELLAKAA